MLSSYGGGHKKSEITFHWIVVLTPLCYISSEFFYSIYFIFNFYCYTVHVVELLNYYTSHCTYTKYNVTKYRMHIRSRAFFAT